MKDRYSRNFPALTEDEQAALGAAGAVIAGCGGLGGYIAEFLARAGIGRLTVIDGDVFEVSNLNRQLLATEENIGRSKAEECRRRLAAVNSGVPVRAFAVRLDADNAAELVRGHDIALDALDNAESRIVLEDACAAEGIPIVHGAIQGWTVQAAAVMPGAGTLRSLYGRAAAQKHVRDEENAASKTSLSFTPPLCAALQASLAVRLLVGRDVPSDALITGDLLRCEFELI